MLRFSKLKSSYPVAPKPEFFTNLGGEWPSLVNNSNYNNTCAVRLSHAMNEAGEPVPSKYKEGADGAGRNLIINVRTMEKLVRDLFGAPSWGMSKPPGTRLSANHIPAVQGVIVYHANWATATGHFDLWTGKEFVGDGNFDDIRDSFDIALWTIE
jgi:hypothetical protein